VELPKGLVYLAAKHIIALLYSDGDILVIPKVT